MSIAVVFEQEPSMNGINFKIFCRWFGKNAFKVPCDDNLEDLVSSFGTLEDDMLSLPMACYYHRLISVVIFGTIIAMQQNSL